MTEIRTQQKGADAGDRPQRRRVGIVAECIPPRNAVPFQQDFLTPQRLEGAWLTLGRRRRLKDEPSAAAANERG